VNGMKLEDKDEVVGMEILPAEGEVLLLASDGKAKRLDEKEFPKQGRYGKGVRIWSLPGKVTLAGIAAGKPNYTATVHLSKAAPKSTRLDAAAVRKRASSKGDVIVEVKPGDEVTALALGWSVERFVTPTGKAPVEKPPKNPKSKAAPGAAGAKRKRLAPAKKTSAKTRAAKKPAKKK
jgi:DNA gyrase C-terminal domain, beta-propeller